jgi:ABC-type transport system involved in multi-copper enzyme maturation permease subunit
MRWTGTPYNGYSGSMKRVGDFALAILLAAASLFAFLLILSSISITQELHLYPSGGAGGFALFLIEVVLALLVALVAGLACLQCVAYGRRFTQQDSRRGAANS